MTAKRKKKEEEMTQTQSKKKRRIYLKEEIQHFYNDVVFEEVLGTIQINGLDVECETLKIDQFGH